MAELVVPRPAELGARGVVVVGVALDAHAVRDPDIGAAAVERLRMPVGARHQKARVHGAFDFFVFH